MPDDVEARERESWQAEEPTWALWEVQRTAVDLGHEIARRMGLPYNDVRALDLLTNSANGLGTVELGNRLGMRSASAAELVDRLVATGHVERRPHPTDRRRVLVVLTEKGYQDAMTVLAPLLARYDRLATELGKDAATVVGYLRAVAAEQRAFCAEPTGS